MTSSMTEQDSIYSGRESMRGLMRDALRDEDRPIPSAPSPPSDIDISDASILSTEPLFPCHITDRQVPISASTPRQYGRRNLSNRSGSIQDSSDVNVTTRTELNVTTRSDVNATSRDTNDSIAAEPTPHVTVTSTAQATNPTTNSTASRLREYELTHQQIQHPLGYWKNGMSSMLACLGTTIGLFNISRFAILSVQFGANFILQFMILSLLVGIPLFTFHVSLGQLLAKGSMQMWKISPVFRGVGISLLMSQLMIGVYSSIGITWMLVYFKDSFITKQDVYRWAVPIDLHRFRDSNLEDVFPHVPINLSFNIKETTADYFHGVVLQRYGSASNEELEPTTNVNYSLALNSAIVWIIVCVCLRKGLKLYGKVIFLYTLFPIFGLFIFCAKLLRLTNPTEVIAENLHDSDWTEFFLNTKSWTAAFSESFYTWGLLGAASMQIAAHNQFKHSLHKDVFVVVLLTFAVLILAGFLGNTCVQLLLSHGYSYVPSSFERTSSYHFLQTKSPALAPNLVSTPIRWMKHSSLILGERTIKPGSNLKHESGYQALRLATELVPATFAALGSSKISPFWSVLFYFSLILIGLAQQLAIWHCVVAGIGSIDKTRTDKFYYVLTVITCLIGFLMGLPLTTESGIYVVYFMDCTIGSAWWIVILYFLEISALFMVRGRPYSGETVVATLFSQSNYFLQNWIAPLFAFDWNVILPVILLFLASSIFRNGGYRQMFNWQQVVGYEYWPLWNRQVGSMIMLTPLILVLIVAIVQTFRYMWSGPADIFDRLQLLYRPNVQLDEGHDNISEGSGDYSPGWPNSSHRQQDNSVEDSPPKYTPPPSYSTATGARLAKAFRQSFRRSVRRVRAALNMPDPPAPPPHSEETPPPEYSVTVEHCMEIPPPGVNTLVHTTAATIVSVDLIGSQSRESAIGIPDEILEHPVQTAPEKLEQAPEVGSQVSDSSSQTSNPAETVAGKCHPSKSDSSQNYYFNGSPRNSSTTVESDASIVYSSHPSSDNSHNNSGSSETNAETECSPDSSGLNSSHQTNSSHNSSGNSSQISSCNSQNSARSSSTNNANSSINTNSSNKAISSNSASESSPSDGDSNCQNSSSSSSDSRTSPSQNTKGPPSSHLFSQNGSQNSYSSQNTSPSSLNRSSQLRGSQIVSSSLRRSNSSHSRRSLRSVHGQSGFIQSHSGPLQGHKRSRPGGSSSVECLVKDIAPINQETVVHLTAESDDEKKDTEV